MKLTHPLPGVPIIPIAFDPNTVEFSRVLAIDPGSSKSAYIVWDFTTIHSMGILPNEELLELLKSSDLLPYHFAAIEMVASYGMAVGKEVFDTCVWVGRFIERTKQPTRLIYRKDVKMHLCQSLRAKDANIRQSLIDKHGVQGTKKNPGPLFGVTSHLIAALAVADFALSTQDKAVYI